MKYFCNSQQEKSDYYSVQNRITPVILTLVCMFFFLILFVPPSGVVLRGKTLHYLSLYLLLVCSLFLGCCLSLLALWLFVAEAHSGDKLNPCLSIFLQQRNTSCLKAEFILGSL